MRVQQLFKQGGARTRKADNEYRILLRILAMAGDIPWRRGLLKYCKSIRAVLQHRMVFTDQRAALGMSFLHNLHYCVGLLAFIQCSGVFKLQAELQTWVVMWVVQNAFKIVFSSGKVLVAHGHFGAV